MKEVKKRIVREKKNHSRENKEVWEKGEKPRAREKGQEKLGPL
jgi:hypothetical protein